MNHRKYHSQGYVPFSWEEKPGIPKVINHHKSKSASNMLMGFELDSPKTMSEGNGRSSAVRAQLMGIAPPPTMPPQKCCSRKNLRQQEDPFLAALKSCTKGEVSKEKNSSKSSFFSCKQSCNVENDNLIKFSKLPPIPKERYGAKSFVRNYY